jgi:urease accessory protein
MSSLIRAVEVLPPGKWPSDGATDRLMLTYDERYRRRMRYVAAGGTVFLLDLPRATVLRAGDGLRLEDGRIVRVEAAPEQLVEVAAPEAATLIRLAWHIGNRHLPAQLEPHRILIREDAVIEHMLVGLGATVKHVLAPFTPEAGAYDNANAAVPGQYTLAPDHAHSHHTLALDHAHSHDSGHTHLPGGHRHD